ncbi:unnamed protein product [Closterium sp. NIES-65]|nr:unnamed protein product [Closterium sp. NIES-65]
MGVVKYETRANGLELSAQRSTQPNPTNPSSPTSPLVPHRLSHPPRHHLSLSPSRSPLPTIPPSSLPLTRHRPPANPAVASSSHPAVASLPSRRRLSLSFAAASPSYPPSPLPPIPTSPPPSSPPPHIPPSPPPHIPSSPPPHIPPSPPPHIPSSPPPHIPSWALAPKPLALGALAPSRMVPCCHVQPFLVGLPRPSSPTKPLLSAQLSPSSPQPSPILVPLSLPTSHPILFITTTLSTPISLLSPPLPSPLHPPHRLPSLSLSFASHRVPFPCSALNGSMLPPLVASLSSASASTGALHPLTTLHPPAPHESALQHAPLSACMPSTCHQPFCQPRFHATRHTRHCAAAGAGGSGGQQQVSLTDGELQERGIAVHWDTALLDYAKLDNLFHRAGFPRRGPKKLQHALAHSTLVLWFSAPQPSPAEPLAFFSSPTSPSPSPPEAAVEPVAFARTAGDGVFNEVVWDVAVDPRLQGSGLGRALMERVVGALLRLGVCNVGLFAEQRVVTFYRPLGFAMDPDGIRCMAHRSHEKKGK